MAPPGNINCLPNELLEMIFLMCILGGCNQGVIALVCRRWRDVLSQVNRLRYQRCITQGDLYLEKTPAPPLNLTPGDKVKLILWDNMAPEYSYNLWCYYDQAYWIAYKGMFDVILDARVPLFLQNMETKKIDQVSPIEMFFYLVGLILMGANFVMSPKVIEHFSNVLGPRWNPIYLYKSVSDSVYENYMRKPFDLLLQRDSILGLFPDCFPFQDDAIDLYCHGCCLLECECPCPSGQHIGSNCRCICSHCNKPRQFQRTPLEQDLCQCINECPKCLKLRQEQSDMYGIEGWDLCECNDDNDFSGKYKYLTQKLEYGEKTYSPWNDTNSGNGYLNGKYRDRDEWLDAYEEHGDNLERLINENGEIREILGNHLERIESWACQGVDGVSS